MNTYKHAFKKAFPYTLPVFTGYLFIGTAFGVMFAEKGYNVFWATLMSILVYAGSGQYLAVTFFIPGFSLIQVAFLTFMVNIRHTFYGLSLLKKFENMGKKYFYMIFSLTDETYSLLCTVKTPPDVNEQKFLFAIAFLDHSYWVLGTIIGSLMGTYLPIDSKGIDFAMTALFIVIFLDLWTEKAKRTPEYIGIICSVLCLNIFGPNNFILPAMLCITAILIFGRKHFEVEEAPCQ
ncbi:MAG: AzlC family ABC transporter permease [Lachnospiraceae bacterium]